MSWCNKVHDISAIANIFIRYNIIFIIVTLMTRVNGWSVSSLDGSVLTDTRPGRRGRIIIMIKNNGELDEILWQHNNAVYLLIYIYIILKVHYNRYWSNIKEEHANTVRAYSELNHLRLHFALIFINRQRAQFPSKIFSVFYVNSLKPKNILTKYVQVSNFHSLFSTQYILRQLDILLNNAPIDYKFKTKTKSTFWSNSIL